MYAYINFGILLLNILLTKILPLKEKKRVKLFLGLIFVQFVLLVGTRTLETGADTYSYYRIFNRISSYAGFEDYIIGYEPLYTLVCLFCAKSGLGFVGLNVCIAALTMYFFCKAVYRLSINVYISIYLYVSSCLFYQMLNQVCQMLAMAIILYAISFLVRDNKKKFVFWVIFACGFHYASVVALVLLALRDISVDKKTVVVYGVSGLSLYIFLPMIMRLLSYTAYGRYIGGQYDIQGQLSTLLNLGVRSVMLLIAAFFYNHLKEKKAGIDIYYHMAIMCLILQLLTTRSALFGRITTFFFYGYFILFPEILEYGYKKKSNKRIMYFIFVLGFFLYHYVYFYYKNNGLFEYSSYLFG